MNSNRKYVAALAVAGILPGAARGDIIPFIGDSTVQGGWTAFDEEHRGVAFWPIVAQVPDLTVVTEIDTPFGNFLLDPAHEKRSVPASWATWSHDGPLTDELFWTNGSPHATYTLPPSGYFDMYVQPNPFDTVSFEVAATGGGDIVTTTVVANGFSGATHVGFYCPCLLETISITADVDFAIAEMRIGLLGSVCFADLNTDGIINAQDLAILLGLWGETGLTCGGSAACPDLNGSGNVGASDLALLLGEWGICTEHIGQRD